MNENELLDNTGNQSNQFTVEIKLDAKLSSLFNGPMRRGVITRV